MIRRKHSGPGPTDPTTNAVAKAMLNVCWIGDATFNDYLHMATAAIDAIHENDGPKPAHTEPLPDFRGFFGPPLRERWRRK